MKSAECPHRSEMKDIQPGSDRCEGCGSQSNLRMCTTCGHVGCCESQKGHNTQHARAAGHPIIRSLPLSDHSFTWCYECSDYLK